MTEWMGVDLPGWFLVVIGLVLVLLVSWKAPSPPGHRNTSNTSNTSGVRADSKGSTGSEEETPASETAKDVALRLGVRVAQRRVPVTVCVNDVVLRRDSSGDWLPIESALRAVALLNEVASVYLVSRVESDEEEGRVKEVALYVGLTRRLSGVTSNPLPLLQNDGAGIPEHRLLFCCSHIGQVAVIRQLTPSLHIGGPISLLEGICRFVPSLVRIDPSAVAPSPDAAPPLAPPVGETTTGSTTAGGSLEWREFTSLASAAGLPPRAPEPLPLSRETHTEPGAAQPRASSAVDPGAEAVAGGAGISTAGLAAL